MVPRCCVLAIVVSICLSFGNAQISEFVQSREIDSIKNSALDALSHPSTLGDAFFATEILKSVKSTGYTCNCATIGSLLKQVSSNLDIYYGISSSLACGCTSDVSADAKSAATKGLKSKNLLEFTGSALACKALGLPTEDVAAKLKTFMVSDGTFRSAVGSKESSVQNTEAASQVLAAYADSISPSVLDDIADTIFPLLPNGEDKTPVDPTLLSYLSRISSKKPRLIGPHLLAVTESLLQLRHSGSRETVALVLESLNFIVTYKASPLSFTFRLSAINSNAISKTLVVDAVDVLGTPVTVESIDVKGLNKVGRDAVLFKGVLTGNSIDLSTVDGIVPGLYSVEVSLTLSGQPKPVSTTLAFVIRGEVDIVNVSVGVSTAKQVSLSDLSSVTEQNSLEEMSASNRDFVHVAFGVSSASKSSERFLKPHQVFVKFTHQESGYSSFFVAAADGKLGEGAGSKYRAAISLSKEVETLQHLSGGYAVSLLVSDVAYGTPVEWVVGSIELVYPAKVVRDFPLYTQPLMYTSDNTLKALPEIVHVMRPDSKRASSFMSSIFTVLTAAPLVVFIGYILYLGPNLKLLQSLSSILFIACLLITLFLYAGYWLALEGVSFYDTIKYLCFLAPITIAIGSSAVSSVAETRMSAAKSS